MTVDERENWSGICGGDRDARGRGTGKRWTTDEGASLETQGCNRMRVMKLN